MTINVLQVETLLLLPGSVGKSTCVSMSSNPTYASVNQALGEGAENELLEFVVKDPVSRAKQKLRSHPTFS